MDVFRKIPICPKMFRPSDDVSVVQREESPDKGFIRVVFPRTRLSDIQKQILDPNLFTIGNILESGQIIEPRDVFNLLNITDVADIERFNDGQNVKIYSFLKENESVLPELFKTKNEES